ncbi:MAG: TIGR04255 family protein, partial [Bacteroidota bacterium]|nr:TIGR04255 family protein [Bacteroidota bacterium]
MSKLPNAPLVEVIFELRWKVDKNDELVKCQYLHGDLFAKVKETYTYREALIASDMPLEFCRNLPTHRFRVAKDEYPLIQIGPGVMTVNTIDSKYIWEDYETQIINTTKNLIDDVYKFRPEQNITLILQYFDILEFSFSEEDVYSFLSDNLNIS